MNRYEIMKRVAWERGSCWFLESHNTRWYAKVSPQRNLSWFRNGKEITDSEAFILLNNLK